MEYNAYARCRTAFLNDKLQGEITSSVQNVLAKVETNSIFETLASQITDVREKLAIWIPALAACVGGNQAQTKAKDDALKALKWSVKNLGASINLLANGDIEVIYASGYPPVAQSSAKEPFAAPEVNSVAITGNRGEVKVMLNPSSRSSGVVQVNGAYSTDNGQTYQNGFADTKSTFIMKDVPGGQNVLFRFSYSGTRNRVSPYSNPVELFTY